MSSSLLRLVRTLRAAPAAALLALAVAGCAEPAPTTPAGANGEGRLAIAMNVSGTTVNLLVAEVTAPDISPRLIFNLPVTNGMATGTLSVPAGSDRLVTLHAFDAAGLETHRGSVMIKVVAGTNPPVSVTLQPLVGDVSLTANFGSTTIALSVATLRLQQATSFNPVVGIVNADGQPVVGTVQWATRNPALVTVTAAGRITAVDGGPGGETEVVATYNGSAAKIRVTVPGDGTQGSLDETAPKLATFTMSPRTFDVTTAPGTIRFTMSGTDVGSGIEYLEANLNGPISNVYRWCHVRPAATDPANSASLTCDLTIPQQSAAGTWTVSYVALRDRRGNLRNIFTSELNSRGMPTTFTVTSTNADATPGVLTGFTASSTVNAADSTARVVFDFTGTDAGVGVDNAHAFVRSPSGVSQWCYAPVIGGTPADAQLRCSLPMGGAEAGTWQIVQIDLYDRVGNYTALSQVQMTAKGWRTTFQVTGAP